jgi:hypothetical protein
MKHTNKITFLGLIFIFFTGVGLLVVMMQSSLGFLYGIVGMFTALATTSLIYYLVLRRHPDRLFLAFLFLLAVAIRFTLAFSLYQASINEGGTGNWLGKDDEFFIVQGSLLLQGYSSVSRLVQVNIYYYLNAFALMVFGTHALPVLLMANALVGGGTVIVAYLLGDILLRNRGARISGLLVAIFPHFVFWGSMNYRDVYLALFWTLSALGLLLYERNKEYSALLLLIGIAGVSLFRVHLGLTAIAGLIVYFILRPLFQNRATRAIRPEISLFLLVTFFVSAYFLFNQYGSLYLSYLQADEAVVMTRTAKLEANSLSGVLATRSVFDAPWLLPVGMLISFVWPFPPWFLPSVSDLGDVQRLNVMFWYALMPYAIHGAFWLWRNDRKALISLGLFIGLGTTLAGLSSYGTLVRSTIPYFPLLLIFATVGILDGKNAAKLVVPFWYVLIGTSFLYAFAKGIIQINIFLPVILICVMTLMIVMILHAYIVKKVY